MMLKHAACNCRWVEATLDRPLPEWLEAWNAPWTCRSDGQPRQLLTTDECADCGRWEPRENPRRPLRSPWAPEV